MRRGDIRTIEAAGRKFDAVYLGKGRHCTAYREGDTVWCFVDEDEYMKDVIFENFDHKAPTPHVPAIDRHDEQYSRGTYRKVYSMPFYPTITAGDEAAWGVLQTLARTADSIFREKYGHKSPLALNGAYFARDIIDATTGKVPDTATTALDDMANAAANYGCGVTFEFGRRNIGVDSEGRIVFRDILFDAEKMQRELNAKLKANRGW